MLLYHPTTIILISVIMLMVSYKHDRLFNLVALFFPIITGIIFFNYAEDGYITIANIVISFTFDEYKKLIGFAFFAVLFAANSYSIGQKKKREIILGSCYGAFTLMSLFASDFISMFIGLELMMIFSSMIIFIGNNRASLRSAKKYFLTHLLSGNMILIGIAHLITKNNDLVIIPITELLNNPNYSPIMIYIMLIGILINIAAFPFSGWMVKYYPKASPAGFLYLIPFTTKLSVVLLANIFFGLEEIRYIAIIMIIYSSIKASMEENIFSLLCYLSIMTMGLMLIGISIGTEEALLATFSYLFIHIMYKSLLSISAAILSDEAGIIHYQQIKKINNKILLVGIITAILMMINIPIFSSFIVKSSISHLLGDNLTYLTTIFLSFMTVFVIPWKKQINFPNVVHIKLNLYSQISIVFMTLILVCITIFSTKIPVLNKINGFNNQEIFSLDVFKQLLIILVGIFASFLLHIKKRDTKPLNLLEWIGVFLFKFYRVKNQIPKNESLKKEELGIEILERQIIAKLNQVHNQQNAIFIVFSLFVVMLLVFISKI
jgi:multicomponent Na+:H+ antiporter subunit D